MVRGCLCAAQPFRESRLDQAQIHRNHVHPLSLDKVETLVKENRELLKRNVMRPRRDVGTYQSDLEILKSMLNEHGGVLRVKFKKRPSEPFIEVRSEEEDDFPNYGSTVIVANPDGFKLSKFVEMSYKKHWLDEEGAIQNRTYIWENEITSQSRTVTAVRTIQAVLDEVLELEVRGREYVEHHKIL